MWLTGQLRSFHQVYEKFGGNSENARSRSAEAFSSDKYNVSSPSPCLCLSLPSDKYVAPSPKRCLCQVFEHVGVRAQSFEDKMKPSPSEGGFIESALMKLREQFFWQIEVLNTDELIIEIGP